MADTKALVQKLSGKYGKERKSLMPILQGIVEEKNYLAVDAMKEVARELDISAAEVYGTASFYSFLDVEVRGEYKIRVCKSITCDMKDKNSIIGTIEDMLKIELGGTTKNERFSLLETNCLGACHQGPAMLINDKLYTELTPVKVREVIGDYIRNGNGQ